MGETAAETAKAEGNNNQKRNVNHEEINAALQYPQEYMDKGPKSEIVEFFKGE
jgi:hypothetical protein